MALPFNDTLHRASTTNLGPDWSEVGGNKWAITAGGLSCSQINPNKEMICLWTGTPGTPDYAVQATVKGGSPYGGAGVVARYLDTNNFYLLDLYMNTLRLYVKRSGAFTMLQTYAAGKTSGVLRLTVQSTTIIGSLDDTVRVSASDNRLAAAGSLGTRQGANVSTWEYFSATSVLAPPPQPPVKTVTLTVGANVALYSSSPPPPPTGTGLLVVSLPEALVSDAYLVWEPQT